MANSSPHIIEYGKEGTELLRDKALEVEHFDTETKDIVHSMLKVFDDQRPSEEGIIPVGLAAPQIGTSKRIFIANWEDKKHIFINPSIKTIGGNLKMMEGCLSFPDIFLSVSRPDRVKINYYNEKGELKKLKSIGFLSRIIQHEYDHLEGKLLSDQPDYKTALEESKKTGKNISQILTEKYDSYYKSDE